MATDMQYTPFISNLSQKVTQETGEHDEVINYKIEILMFRF